MSYLSTDEALSVGADILEMITSSQESAVLFTKAVAATGSFAGDGAPGFDPPGNTTPVIAQDKQPNDLLQVDHDYILLLLPDTAVKDGDEIDFRGGRFRVVDIQRVNLFGTVTHQVVAVKKLRGA